MNPNGVDKYYPGSIAVGKSVQTKEVLTDKLNGREVDEYLTKENIPNSDTVKNFKETDDGLMWKGVILVPPNEIMEDRPYTANEVSEMVTNIWDKYDGTVDDDKVDEKVDTTPDGENGTISTDWES